MNRKIVSWFTFPTIVCWCLVLTMDTSKLSKLSQLTAISSHKSIENTEKLYQSFLNLIEELKRHNQNPDIKECIKYLFFRQSLSLNDKSIEIISNYIRFKRLKPKRRRKSKIKATQKIEKSGLSVDLPQSVLTNIASNLTIDDLTNS